MSVVSYTFKGASTHQAVCAWCGTAFPHPAPPADEYDAEDQAVAGGWAADAVGDLTCTAHSQPSQGDPAMTNDQIFEALREIVTLARTDPAARCEFDLPLLCGWRHRSELGAMVNRARSAGAVVSLAETGQDMGRTYYQVTAYGSAEALKDVANFILAVAS